MIILSDTSPINYLILIGEIEVLRKLAGRIIIPQAVFVELQNQKTPESVRAWIDSRPDWLEVHQANLSLYMPKKKLGAGEHEAIAWRLSFMLMLSCLMIGMVLKKPCASTSQHFLPSASLKKLPNRICLICLMPLLGSRGQASICRPMKLFRQHCKEI